MRGKLTFVIFPGLIFILILVFITVVEARIHGVCSNPAWSADNSMSHFCTGCRGDFYGISPSVNGDGHSSWLRHPTNISLPSRGEICILYRLQSVGPYSQGPGPFDWNGRADFFCGAGERLSYVPILSLGPRISLCGYASSELFGGLQSQ